MMDYKAYERKMNSVYDMVGEGKYKAAAKTAATLLEKYRGDAQLTAVRAFCLQQMGQGGEAAQLARAALLSPGNPPCAHSMGIATRVLTNAGRSSDAVAAWRSAAAAFPEDEELQEGLFQSAAGSLEYAALQTAAVRLMKLKNKIAEASSAGEKLSASWAAATATALAAEHAGNDGEVGPLGKAGLRKLARAMVDQLEKGSSKLTSQQLSLVRALRGEGGGGGDDQKVAAASGLLEPEIDDNDAVSIPDAFSDLKRTLSGACREALKTPGGGTEKLDAVSAASRAVFARRGATPGAAAAAARVVSRAVFARSRSSSLSDSSAAVAVSVARAAVAGAREAARTAKTAAATAVSAEDFSAALLGFSDYDDGDDDDEKEERASQYRQSLLSIVPPDALPPPFSGGEPGGARDDEEEKTAREQIDAEAAIGAALLAVEAHVVAGRRKKRFHTSAHSTSSAASASDHFAAAFLLAEACCSLDPLDPRARLAAASVAGLLGDAGSARLHGEALSLKHILADTLGSHLLLPALLAAGDGRGAAELCGRIAALHSGARAEVGGALKAALTNQSSGGGDQGGGGDACSGNFGVALSLAEFASSLSRSHEKRVAAVSAATARVEAAAVVDGAGGASSSSPAAIVAVAVAAAAAVADLAWVDALPRGPSSPSSSSPVVVFTEDFSPRPRWLPPPRGDVRLAVRRWWEEEEEEEEGGEEEGAQGAATTTKKKPQKLNSSRAFSPPWWSEHGAAFSESLPQASEWRLAASEALRERARLPGRLLAALELRKEADGEEEVEGGERETRACPPRRQLSDLPGEVERTLWAAADAVAAAANGGEEEEKEETASTTAALSALSSAAEAFSSSAEAVSRAVKEEEEGEEAASHILSLGSPLTSGVALALAHTAALAAAVAASWRESCSKKDDKPLLPEALLPGVAELASAARGLASLLATAPPPRASAAAIEKRLSGSAEFSRVLRWVGGGRGGGTGGGGGDNSSSNSVPLLDVREALSRLVAGQAAAASAAAAAARGAAAEVW